ncbi:MAG TPA: NAD(P)-binding protein, partial [Geminicoccaceae bacterium]|nr:NAD(P)-binding protein [Geminicoccaceae bacterium]
MSDENLSSGAATARTLEPPAVMRQSWPMAEGDTRLDLIIVGGGMTGLALACAVAGAGVPVLLIEQRALPETTALPFDGRVTAIAQG